MKGMIAFLTLLIFGFITSTCPLSLKGTSAASTEQEKGKTNVEEFLPESKKETLGGAGKTVVFLCRSACRDTASSARKGNSSGCQIFLGKVSGNGKAYKHPFKFCSRCSCNPKIKELTRESKTQTDLQASNSFRSPTLVLNRRNSNPQTQISNQYNFPKDESKTLKFSQKYNPRSKSSESGFVPVPGPYGFKPSTTKYPRQSQYRSDSYDDITDRDYYDTGYEEEDVLGSGHFEILRGGVFSYNDNNHLGHGHRVDYTESYNYVPKNSKHTDRPFSSRFQFSFPDILSTERRSEMTQATNSKGVLSHLFASTSDLVSTD